MVRIIIVALMIVGLVGCTSTPKVVEQPAKQHQLILKVDPALLVPPHKLETFE